MKVAITPCGKCETNKEGERTDEKTQKGRDTCE